MKTLPQRATEILPYVFVFIASLHLPSDPDLGWHLKYGEYFFTHHQILRENIFSTMMPQYHWANGSWGTDILTYAIFHYSGFFGLTLASAAIVTVTFFFFAKASRLTFLEEAFFFPLFLYLENDLNSVSFKGQQISMLFLGILVFLLSRYKPFSKIFFFIPVLFLFWCNMQEESFLGLAIFGMWLLTYIGIAIKKEGTRKAKKEIGFLISIFTVTFLVTFINPFGWGIHLTALSHIQDPLLKTVSEYVPFPAFSPLWWNETIITLISFIILISLAFKKSLRDNFPLFILPIIFLLLSFSVRRYVWPAYYLSLFLFHIPGQFITSYARKYAVLIAFIILLISIGYVMQQKLPFDQFTSMSWNTYCQLQSVSCDPVSAEYLQKNKLQGKLFSYYDWGGWLIWNYPGIKPNIDGRMHVWRDANGYSATEEYAAYENGQKSIDKSPYDIVYLPNDQSPLAAELSTLIQQKKWKIAYEDELSGIVVRIK